MQKRRRAFTLVELLVVIGIICILIGMLLPAVHAAREAARRMQCNNNLRQITVALQTYESTYGVFPPGGYKEGNQLGWHARVLPYLEQQALYEKIDWSDTYPNILDKFYNEPMPLLWCPSASSGEELRGIWSSCYRDGVFAYTQHYHGVAGPYDGDPTGPFADVHKTGMEHHFSCSGYGDRRGWAVGGILYVDSKTTYKDITDGSSHTLLVGERRGGESSWIAGVSNRPNWPCDSAAMKNFEFEINSNIEATLGGDTVGNSRPFGSYHPGGANFSLADGAIRFLSEATSIEVLRAMASRAGGEVETYDKP